MMDRNAQDELLSAYLDGELSEAERQGVEQRLRSDPEARRTLDGLRKAAAAMQSLPRGRAPAELAEAVRARLERRALLEPATASPRRGWNGRFFAVAAAVALTAGLAFFMSPNETARHAEVALTRSATVRSSDAAVALKTESAPAERPVVQDIAHDAEAKQKLAALGYMEADGVDNSRSRRDVKQEADTKGIDSGALGSPAQAAAEFRRQIVTHKQAVVLDPDQPQAAQGGIGTAERLYRAAEPFGKAAGEREMTASEAAVEIAALNARLEAERGVAPIPVTAAESPLDKNEILRKAFSITTTTNSAASPQPVDVSSEPKLRAGPVMIVSAPSDAGVNGLDRALQSAVAAAQVDVPQVRLVNKHRQLRDEPQGGAAARSAAALPPSDARITNEFQVAVPRMQLAAVARRIADEARAQQVRVSLEADSAAPWTEVASAVSAAQSATPSVTPLQVAALGGRSGGEAVEKSNGLMDAAEARTVRANRPATPAPARERIAGGGPATPRPRLGIPAGEADSQREGDSDAGKKESARSTAARKPTAAGRGSREVVPPRVASPPPVAASAPSSHSRGGAANAPAASNAAGDGDEMILMTVRILAPGTASRESPRE